MVRCCSRICCSIAPPTRPRSCSPTHRRPRPLVPPASRRAGRNLPLLCGAAVPPSAPVHTTVPTVPLRCAAQPSASRAHPAAQRSPSWCHGAIAVPAAGRCCVPCRAVPCRVGVWARSTWSYGRLRRRKARRPAAQRPRSTSGARSPSARGSRMLSSKVRPPSPAPSVVAGQSAKIGSFCGGASARATGDGASRAHRLPHWMYTRSSVSKLAERPSKCCPNASCRGGWPVGAKARATLCG